MRRTTTRSSASSSRLVSPRYSTSEGARISQTLCQPLAIEVVEPADPLGQEVGPEVARERLAVAGGPGGHDPLVQLGGVGGDRVGGEVRVVAGRLGGGEVDARGALAAALAQRGGLEQAEAEQRERR